MSRPAGVSCSKTRAILATITGPLSSDGGQAMINRFDERLARERCRRYRRRILDISQQVAALHIGSAYSCTEIVDCMYHGLMRRNADGSSPDTFLMSKGHGCMIQYVILEDHGMLGHADLEAS